MRKEDLFDALCDIDSSLVKEAHRKNKTKTARKWRFEVTNRAVFWHECLNLLHCSN